MPIKKVRWQKIRKMYINHFRFIQIHHFIFLKKKLTILIISFEKKRYFDTDF